MAIMASRTDKDSRFESTFRKLDFVLQQILGPSAKPAEDLKVDRFLDQIQLQLQHADFVTELLHDDTGFVKFLNKCSNEGKLQTWVMTFALKLWSTLLSCPHSDMLLNQTAESACVPSYVAVIGGQVNDQGQVEVKGHLLGQSLLNLLRAARCSEYWDEASVRNGWLLAVSQFIKASRDQQLLMENLLKQSDAVDVAFRCLDDSSMFVVASAQDLLSSLLHNRCFLALKSQGQPSGHGLGESHQELINSTEGSNETSPTSAKIRKLDSSAVTRTEPTASQSQAILQFECLLQRLTQTLQTSTQVPSQAQSRLPTHHPGNPTRATNLRLAAIGIVKRLWQTCDKDILRLLDEKLSWLSWCQKTLQEDGEQTRDVRLAVVESLPVVLSKWPWSSDMTSCTRGSQQVRALTDLFQLPVIALRWHGVQYSLQLARVLHNAQCLMSTRITPDVMELIECNPSLLKILTLPLTAILQPPGTPKPRRKLLGFANPHADAATRLAEVLDEVVLQLVEGKVSAVKLMCQCLDGLLDIIKKMPLELVIQDLCLLKHLSSLFVICWSKEQQDETQPSNVNIGQKLKRSSKVIKVALGVLAAVLDKITKESGDFSPEPKSLQCVLKEIAASLTNILSVSINDQALMCKTLDVLTKLFKTKQDASLDDSILSPSLLDCVLGLAVETCWEIRDSALSFLVAVIQYGSDSEVTEAKIRRFHHVIWECVGDYEGFVQASAVSALPVVYKKKTLWEDMILQCKINEVGVVSNIVHFLRVSGNPFVRSAAIATLTRWLTDHSGIQSSVLQACQVPLCKTAPQTKLSSSNSQSTDNVEADNTRKPAPKDIPGVVSGYFQDVLEEVGSSTLPKKNDHQDKPQDTANTETKSSAYSCTNDIGTAAGDTSCTISSLPSKFIGQQILSTMYYATNSTDVETSCKTLDFWGCLFWLHTPQYIIGCSSPDVSKVHSGAKSAEELQELFDSGSLSQELVLSSISKPSQESLESLKHCLENTRCLALLLGMLTDSKMVAERVCFMLQILQGLFLASDSSTSTMPTLEEQQSHVKGSESKQTEELPSEVVTTKTEDSGDRESSRSNTDLHQVLGRLSLGVPFREVFANFLQMDFVAVGQIIKNREQDTLESTLDDLIEPDEEWGLPGDINVDCY